MKNVALLVCIVLCLISTVSKAEKIFEADLIQPPTLAAPKAGFAAGSYATFSADSADGTQGTVPISLPIAFPEDRGPLLVDLIPTYRYSQGLSEWGQGWTSNLSITRFKELGSISYLEDSFMSPWGELRAGNDGFFYPKGLSTRVRVEKSSDGQQFTAYLPTGVELTFGSSARISNAKGNFAWYLVQAKSKEGYRTALTYEKNATGRPFLKTVEYGGRSVSQYKITVNYQTQSERLMLDFRSGFELSLDRLVSNIKTEVRTPDGFKTRWQYDLAYKQVDEGVRYVLKSVQKTLSDGVKEPPVSFDYATLEDASKQNTLVNQNHLSEVVKGLPAAEFYNQSLTYYDANNDGYMDIERGDTLETFQYQDGKFIKTAQLDPAGMDANCKSRFTPNPDPNLAIGRNLLRFQGPGKPYFQLNFVESREGIIHDTDLYVCDLKGKQVYTQHFKGMYAELEPNEFHKIADINGDGKPDFVWLWYSRFVIRLNESTDTEFKVGPEIHIAINEVPDQQVPNYAIYDINGDGLADIVGKGQYGYQVYYNLGNAQFATKSVYIPFVSRFGQVEDISKLEQIFVDLNRDGLVDVVTVNKELGVVLTWLNRGKEFKQVLIQNTLKIPEIASSPRAIDLIGTGDDQIIYTAGLGKWQTLAFNRPETGLLTRIDNGKGIEIVFGYQRSPAIPFAITRMPVIGSVKVRKGLADPLTTILAPAFPKIDSNGRLLGYSRMESVTAGARKISTFSIDEELGSALVALESTDNKIAGLKKVEEKAYLGLDFQGLAVRVPKLETEYWVEGQKRSRSLTTSYLDYDKNICAKSTQSTSDGETLLSSLTFSALPSFEKVIHCKVDTEQLAGKHANPEKDFTYITRIDRTAAGQEKAVWRLVDGKQILIESAEYDSDFRLISSLAPGKGTTTIGYHPLFGIPDTVTNPDGTYIKVGEFDSISTMIVQLDTYRGSGKFSQRFGFDSRDRLTSSTHSLFDPSLKSALTEYTYQDAAIQKAGFLRTFSASDDGTGVITRYETAEAFDASARSLGKLLKLDRGWIRTRWTDINDEGNASRQLWTPSTGAAIQDLLSQELTKGIELSAEDKTAFGVLKSSKLWEVGKSEARNTTWHVSDTGDLVKENFLNGRTLGKIFTNPQGKTVAYVDALDNRFAFDHDALGRVVDVRLPSGTEQHLIFDKFGQAQRIDHSQVGSISYEYYPDSRLLKTKTFYDRAGAVDRSESLAYDAAGRVIKKDFAKGTDVKSFSFTFNQDPASDQFAYLESITGPGYKKGFQYREDGKIRSKSLTFFSGPVLTKVFSYTKTDETRQETWTYSRDGKTIASSQKTFSYDAYGRTRNIAFPNGSIDLEYDDASRLLDLTFGTQSLHFNYDSASQLMSGYAANGLRPDRWEFSWHYNSDGQTESETYFYPSFSGKTAAYDYDERFFLKSAERDNLLSYAFDGDGLGTLVASKELVREPGRFTIGDTVYSFDSSRRVQSKGSDTYEYGHQGRMTRLLRGQTRISSYDYDENSELIARDGTESFYYFDGVVANDVSFAEPVRIGGVVVGFLTNGRFEFSPYDNRGTALPRGETIKKWAEPFGSRDQSKDIRLAFDYAGNYRDSDSGLVVMGARFYEANLGIFTTPDPLFLEDLGQCEKSPFECNLYSYAQNNPLKFVDPTGTNTLVLGGAGPEAETEKYAPVLVSKFASAGVVKPEYVPISSGGKFGNLARTLTYRDQPFENTAVNRVVGTLTNFQNTQVKIFHASNRAGGQRNLLGYSYGSVMAAQAALRMANMGIKIDNLGLIGSPISSDSKLYQSLIRNPNIGNVTRFDIKNDPFSNGIDLKSWDKLDLPGLATGNHIHFDYMQNDRSQQDQLSKDISNAFSNK